MNGEEMQKRWKETSEEILSGMAEWREQYSKATFREMEEEVDKRLSELRVRMLTDVAISRAEEEWAAGVCPTCGVKLEKKGKKKRKLQTRGGREVELEREYGVCPVCGQGIFPPG
ncbi:MAG: hypothetical protein IH588_06235 [Anaerolineales bacterium]|nr:hypothetical protein [Anaerolineales bacterium]